VLRLDVAVAALLLLTGRDDGMWPQFPITGFPGSPNKVMLRLLRRKS